MADTVRRSEAFAFLAGLPLVGVAATACVATLQLLSGMQLRSATCVLIAGLVTLLIFFAVRRSFQKLGTADFAMLSGLTLVFCAASFFLATKIYDVSYDGQTYHYEAVRQLVSGWNYLVPPSYPAPREEMAYTAPFLTHYCKLPWLLEAVVAQLSGTIEGAKCIHPLLLWSAFWSCLAWFVRLRIRFEVGALVALACALNPVSVTQAPTFYVDGLFASTITALVSQIGLWLTLPSAFSTATLGATLLLALNLKFTSTVAAGLLCAIVLGCVLWGRARGYDRSPSDRTMIGLSLFAAFCVFGVGFQPFVTNWAATGNVFYPIPQYDLPGKTVDSPAIQQMQIPKNLQDEGRFMKLALSLFSESANPLGDTPASLKLPFEMKRKEFQIFRDPDVRVAGFGPVFTLSILIALLAAAFSLCSRSGSNSFSSCAQLYFRLGIPIWIVLSVLVVPESWWARYVPQLWLLPLLLSLQVLEQQNSSRGLAFQTFLSGLSVVLVTANSVAIGFVSWSSAYTRSAALKAELSEIAAEGRAVEVTFNRFRANEERLRHFGVNFAEVPVPICDAPRLLLESPTSICSK
ncbi:MAG: hypothetical protein U0136_18205 [Bdellovibrionota bacterium]